MSLTRADRIVVGAVVAVLAALAVAMIASTGLVIVWLATA